MSESIRGRRWRRQRRALRVLAAACLIWATTYIWHSKSPALTQRIQKVAAGRRGVAAHLAKPSLKRPIYPYSIIRGGVYSAAELTDALAHDPVAARHYAGFHRSSARITQTSFSQAVYLSYRVGNAVYWTGKAVQLPSGETVLTDGQNVARARCGNRISPTPQTPVNDTEPAPETLDTPQPPANTIADLNTWSEDRLTADGTPLFSQPPALPMPISTSAGFGGRLEAAPLWWSDVVPGGFLNMPVVAGIPRNQSPVIQPEPIPGLVFPPGTPPVIFPTTPPPDIWPPLPPVTPIPGNPLVPIDTPIIPTQAVPEPTLLPIVLLAFGAVTVAKYWQGTSRCRRPR